MESTVVNPLLSFLFSLNFTLEDTKLYEVPEPHGSCDECLKIKIEHDITFLLYTNRNPEKSEKLRLDDEKSLIVSHFNPEHDTVIIIHGFGGSASDLFSTTLSNVLLKHGKHNIILMDWRKLSAGPIHYYPYATKNVKIAGERLAKLIEWMQEHTSFNASSCHVIGFSLGAHVAGFMGKALGRIKVGRISGLDPAGPSFDVKNPKLRLDRSDAIFVDVIYSNWAFAGIMLDIGHANFYPNNGSWQPGCIHKHAHIGCSHRRAWRYFVESVSNRYGFPAFKCESLIPVLKNCDKNPTAYMGLVADPKKHGIFLVHTNAQQPFAKHFNYDSNDSF